ncbi:MAG: glycosyltransferase family 2 protein [Patescibacteria group bacterium]|jgi:GT2 family glycosyltransferase
MPVANSQGKGEKVTVIVVNWNGRKFLERLFNSLRTQTHKDLEIIMVDNASADDSVAYVKKSFPKVIVLDSPNLGYTHGCNVGAEAATGRYVTFYNVDMYFPEDHFEKMIAFYRELSKTNRKIGGIGCKIIPFDSDPKDFPVPYGGHIDLFGYPINIWDEHDIFGICGSPFFTELFVYRKIGGFSEHIFLYGEDVEISWRARIFGYKLFVNPNAHLYHFGSGVSEGFKSKKIALLLASSIIPSLYCHSSLMLVLVMPLYALFIISALTFLTLYGRLDTTIAGEYIKSIRNILEKLPSILRFRKFVQRERVLSGMETMKYISFIPSPLYNRWWNLLAQKDLWK